MSAFLSDKSKNIVLLINDYNEEFGIATDKLSKIIGRELTGYVLVDSEVKKQKKNKPIINSNFNEIVCDYSSPTSIAKALAQIRDCLLVVNASSESNQPYFLKIIPHIPYLLAPTESSILWSTQKDLMKKQILSYNPAISTETFQLDQEATTNLENFVSTSKMNFPIISKPAGLAASILVKKSSTMLELHKNVEDSFKSLEQVYTSYRGRGEPKLLLEEFMGDDMYSIDAYVTFDGKITCLPPVRVITAASLGLEGFYSYKRSTNHGLSDKEIEKANFVAASSIRAVGLRASVVHIELFKTELGWKVIELAPRAGGYRQDLYELAYNFDHALNELLIKINMPPIINTRPKRTAAAFNIYAKKEGVISSIDGFDAIRQYPGILRMKQYAFTGDRAIFCGNGGKYIFDGVVFAEDEKKTEILLQKIRDEIKINVA
jgi:hypothetical protein